MTGKGYEKGRKVIKESGNKRKIGADHEEQAAGFLRQKGLKVLERNFRCRQGEIDLVCMEGEYYVFVEVKYRRDLSKGAPEAAVGITKQKKICKVADYYRLMHHLGEEVNIRYDVVAIVGEEIHWLRNAFPHHYTK